LTLVGLVPLLDQLDAVRCKPVAHPEDGLAVGQSDAEVHPRGAGDRLVGGTQREREAGGVVEHEYAVVVASCGPRSEPEVRLVEPARALLVADRDCEVIHARPS
jgi:hypothetical protein